MSKKRIVHLIRTLEIGGCETALLRMLPLTNNALQHTIITLGQGGTLAKRFQGENISVIALEQDNFFDIASYIRLRRILKDISPNLIITHLLHADIVGRLYAQYVIQCNLISSIVTTYNFGRYWPARLFERITKRLAKHYMANSKSVKEVYVREFGVKEEKITVAPRGIDINSFLNTENVQILQKELLISNTDRVIICVANLHPNKGHRYLLTAFEKLFPCYPNTKLLIVGTGSEKENLLAQVTGFVSKNAIHFLGKREDVPRLLHVSHIFVLPTFFEGMSNAIMEAMASGLPIVTTNIPENKELVTHEKTGLLCPTKDSDSLAKILIRLIENESFARELGENGSEVMRTAYNLDITSKLWESYFIEMTQSNA